MSTGMHWMGKAVWRLAGVVCGVSFVAVLSGSPFVMAGGFGPAPLKTPNPKEPSMAYVRWSELEIDREQLARFSLLASENIRQTRLAEPGVIAFFSRAERDHPHRFRVLEVYADASAYQAHLKTPHFQKFRSATSGMVMDRKLFEAVPVALGAKPYLPPSSAVVRIAELEIDPARLAAYKAVVIEEINASIRVEPGVLAIYALALKDQPNHLRFFEIYADEQAYLHHRETPHFKKYLAATQDMIGARKLIETAPGADVAVGGGYSEQ